MKKVFSLSLILLLFMAIMPLTDVFAQTPSTISYQGRIMGDDGLPVTDGDHLVSFSIYTEATGGTPVFVEPHNVTFEQGFFNVYLGSISSLDNVPFNQELWLEVKYEDNPPYDRVKLSAVPFSFYTLTAEVAVKADLATTVEDAAITQEKLADGVMAIPMGPAGGSLEGDYPNPTISEESILAAIGPGSITQDKLASNITAIPIGEARGDLVGFYPEPTIRPGSIKTEYFATGVVIEEVLGDDAVTTVKIMDDAVTLDKHYPATQMAQIMYYDTLTGSWKYSGGPDPVAPLGDQIMKWNAVDGWIEWDVDGLYIPYEYEGPTVGGAPMFSLSKTDLVGDGMEIIYAPSGTFTPTGNALTVEAIAGHAILASNNSNSFSTISATNIGGQAFKASGAPVPDGYVAEIMKTDMVDGKTMYINGRTSNKDGEDPAKAMNRNAVVIIDNQYDGLALVAYGDGFFNGDLGTSGTFSASALLADDLFINNTGWFGGDVDMDGTLDVLGATILNNTLDVTGAATLGSTLEVTGVATLSDNLNVTGNYTSALGNFTLTAGNASIGGTLGVTGIATLSDNLNVTGDYTSTNGNLTLTNGNAIIGGTLGVTGIATLSNNLVVVGDYSSVAGDITLTGGTLTVGGLSTLATVDVNGGNIDATVIGATTPAAANFTTVGTTSDVMVGGNIDVTGHYTSTAGNFTLTGGNAVIGGTLGVTGITTLGNNLVVVGDYSSVAGDITLTGGTLTVGGLSTLASVDINGGNIDATVIGAAIPAAADFTTVGTTGDVTVGGNIAVTGNYTSATGNLELTAGTLTVGGLSTLATVDINAGNIDNTAIGAAVPSTGAFTTLSTTGDATLGANVAVTGDYTSTDGHITLTNGNLTLTNGNFSVGGTLGVTGLTTAGDVNVGGNLGVTGDYTSALGDITLTGGTLTVGGLSTLTSVDINGGNIDNTAIGVATPAEGHFTTLSTTGAATLGSTLNVTGDVAVNTNKFNVTAASGNTAIAGTLDVTGASTLASTLGVSGVVTITNATSATTPTSAALVVTGGIGTSENLVVDGNGIFGDGSGTNNVQIANDGSAPAFYVTGGATAVDVIGGVAIDGDLTVTTGTGTFATVDINGGAIDGTAIGATTPSTGVFTTVNTGQGAYELYAMNQDVETTDAVTFATVNTGQGDNELYAMNQDVQTTDDVTFANMTATTLNTGQGAYELYAMNQDVETTDAVTFATVNTGNGDNELYAMDQNVQTTDAVTFATVNTGQGAYELYAMNQDVETTDAVTFATVNTGNGDNELYAMDQNVQTTDAVTFATLNTGQGAYELYAMNQDVETTDAVTFDAITITTGLTLPTNSITDDAVVDALTISGGTIENTPIGQTTAAAGTFTTLATTGSASIGTGLAVNGNYTSATGNINLSAGQISVGGAANMLSTLDVTGDVTVNTNKFSVTAASGNTAVGGALDVTGDVSVNTNKFNVTAATGNTAVGGALDVTGDVSVNTNKFNIVAASGNTTIAGTLDVTGTSTVGTLNATGNATFDGSVVVGDAATDNIAMNGTITTGLMFEGSSVDANDLTIAIENPTAARTITFPDADGTLALNENVTLQGAYNNSNTITVNATNSSFEVRSSTASLDAYKVVSNQSGSAITAYANAYGADNQGNAIFASSNRNSYTFYSENNYDGSGVTNAPAGYFTIQAAASPSAAIVAYNASDGPGIYASTDDAGGTGTAYAVRAETYGLGAAIYAYNGNNPGDFGGSDDAVALQLAAGKMIMSMADGTTADNDGDLSNDDIGYANIISVDNAVITALPGGTTGQVLYISNTSGGGVTVLGTVIADDTMTMFIYDGATWLPVQ